MNATLRNIMAVIAGIIIGGIVNSGLISLSGSIIPLPAEVDPNDIESIKANMHLYEAKHFLMPFLAHAIGTLAGAFAATAIAASHHLKLSLVIGAVFLLGGIMVAQMLPAPLWFEALDIVLAYIPMAWLGHKIAYKNRTPDPVN